MRKKDAGTSASAAPARARIGRPAATISASRKGTRFNHCAGRREGRNAFHGRIGEYPAAEAGCPEGVAAIWNILTCASGRESGGERRLMARQGAVLLQVTEGVGGAAQPLAEVSGVVVRVRVARIEGERPFVSRERIGGPLQVLQSHAAVAGPRGVLRPRLERPPVKDLGLGGIPRFVKQSSQVHERVGMSG